MSNTEPQPHEDSAGYNLMFLCNILPLPLETLKDMRDYLARFYTCEQIKMICEQIKRKERRTHKSE